MLRFLSETGRSRFPLLVLPFTDFEKDVARLMDTVAASVLAYR